MRSFLFCSSFEIFFDMSKGILSLIFLCCIVISLVTIVFISYPFRIAGHFLLKGNLMQEGDPLLNWSGPGSTREIFRKPNEVCFHCIKFCQRSIYSCLPKTLFYGRESSRKNFTWYWRKRVFQLSVLKERIKCLLPLIYSRQPS